jgi:hypothetical protein
MVTRYCNMIQGASAQQKALDTMKYELKQQRSFSSSLQLGHVALSGEYEAAV